VPPPNFLNELTETRRTPTRIVETNDRLTLPAKNADAALATGNWQWIQATGMRCCSMMGISSSKSAGFDSTRKIPASIAG
jgi:hypothetical protein